ncbi:AMP-binding protein [Tropicibacter sp. Alg240-R139]|uniref:AMP-binding protein n=1 Tax=Tropicibacter sp. Alg240-R139 TaxID=2305991 RepID=UPI0013E064A4|nr:AMP-binding protein [Tropicibacter sp. Alg240-R139]
MVTQTQDGGLAVAARPAAPAGGLSLVKGPVTPDLMRKTIPQLLRDAVEAFGERDAAVFCEQGVRVSYEQLAAAVDELAAGLLAIGLSKGDRVGIWSPNRYEWVLTQFATARVGLILVNINPAYRLGELEYALNKVACRALITARAFKTSDYVGMIRDLAPELNTCAPGQLQAEKLPHLRSVVVTDLESDAGMYSFDQVRDLGHAVERVELDEIEVTLSPDDPINIQFTSGTTGMPKGATLSHNNIVNNGRLVTDLINLTKDEALAIPVPLYHCFGMVMGVLGAVSKGAKMVFPGEGFDAAQTLDALEAEGCSAVYGVPTMFVAMLEDLEQKPRDLSAMRTGIMAGATCPVEVMERVNSEMNMPEVTICYGMTETSPVSFQSFVDDPTDKRCETVGRVHPHLEVKIIDTDGNTVAVGEQGELCTRGYSVMTGYWGEEEKTAESIVDGWMHTGDLATFDPQGFCSIVGRVKDMIIRGGENIYPREVEEYLIRHPKVSDVQVFGIPDDRFGEQVCAWVIAKPGETVTPTEVLEFTKGQIAHYKVPKHIRIVDELPMTITGKPQKFVMRDKMVEMLQQQAG